MNCIFAAHIEYRNISVQNTVSLSKTPLSYITPMHTLPLFCPTPCISSPYSIPPMHALPLFYPTHACPPPILSQLMHTLPPILSQPIHTLPLFHSTPYMPSPYSIPLYACPLLFSTSPHMPPQYSIPAHACPPNSLSHVSPLTSENAAFESAHTEYIIII